jgi:hypothetical protein
MFNRPRVLNLLHNWATNAESHWYELPEGQGCYGTGYNNWGVQTNQKYVTALAALSSCTDYDAAHLGIDREHFRQRALAALRFSFNSHLSGEGYCTDGQKWGCTWISALGIERMMTGVLALRPYFTPQDEMNLQSLLTCEANWLLHDYHRGEHRGINAGLWSTSGKNDPESNGWNGALLWRTAAMYPDHVDASLWIERSHEFLMNAVSIAADAQDDTIIAGKPVSEWHIGANFFDNYALDHHGYLNVGYMIICVSGAAMLHADLKVAGMPRPESLDWHQADLWRVLRRLIFSDGRLARIGGDTRVRYAYCQEYLLPSLLYASEQLGEQYAPEILNAQLKLIEEEAAFNGDGSFYGKRLKNLNSQNPYYYTRLESDRSCALGLLLLNAPQSSSGIEVSISDNRSADLKPSSFEESVFGGWEDPDHGVAVHRCDSRFASFAWRGFGLGQGLCLPPNQGHLAEWEGNLGITSRFMGDDGVIAGGQTARRRVINHHIESFEGGFLTYGTIEEGTNLTVQEGWSGSGMAQSQIVFAALPDGHTVLGLQYCRAANLRSFPLEIKGLQWRVPNDLYNGFNRTLTTQNGEFILHSPCPQEEVLSLGSWANCAEKVGVIGLYGATDLKVHRQPHRNAGKYRSLYVEDICWGFHLGARSALPNEILLDTGWAMLSDVTSEQTRHFAESNALSVLDLPKDCRGVRIVGLDEKCYELVANFGLEPQLLHNMTIAAGEARLIKIETNDR